MVLSLKWFTRMSSLNAQISREVYECLWNVSVPAYQAGTFLGLYGNENRIRTLFAGRTGRTLLDYLYLNLSKIKK